MRLIKKIVFYLTVIIALSYLLRFIVYQGIRSNVSGTFDKLNEIFLRSNPCDILIVGSSRAECHFDTHIIDSVTGLNSYNIGISGSNNSFTYGILKTYLASRKVPKYAVINIDYHFAHESSDTIYEFPRFFPYLSNELLYQELKKRDNRFVMFKYNPFYSLPFLGDKYLNISFRGYSNEPSDYDKSCYKGYQFINPIEYKNINKNDTLKYKATVLPENLSYLDSMIALCYSKKITLCLVVSPIHKIVNNRIINLVEHVDKFRNHAEKNQIPFFDYSQDEVCSIDSLFADPYHMKKAGAEQFSRKFAQAYKDSILK